VGTKNKFEIASKSHEEHAAHATGRSYLLLWRVIAGILKPIEAVVDAVRALHVADAHFWIKHQGLDSRIVVRSG